MAVDYREKIRKLLALSESNNENEAKDALLKARKLMAEHKISEAECAMPVSDEVVTVDTKISFTARTNSWISELATVISENYCCRCYAHVEGRTYYINFVGFKEDAQVCSMIFKYAVDSIESMQKSLRKKVRKENPCHKFTNKEFTTIFNSYGNGFVAGVKEMYEKQDEENQEYGLVLSTPEEVNDAFGNMGLKTKSISCAGHSSAFSGQANSAGYQDGLKFDPNRKIASAV